MKYLFIALLVFVFNDCIGQKKDTTFKTAGWQLSVMGVDSTIHGEMYIIFKSDSTIEIYGDTTEALWMVYKYLSEYSEKYWAAKRVLDHMNIDFIRRELIKSKSFSEAVKDYKSVQKKYTPKN